METAWSADIQVTASVDKQELTLEDSVYFSIVVEGTQSSVSPELPPLDSFKIRPLGSSSSYQIINSERSSSISYNFVLIPKEIGTFTIEPITVNIDGKKYQTEPITLMVKKTSIDPDTLREVFAEMVVSNTRPYVQEQVTATLRIFHRVKVRNLVTDIQYPGFREVLLNKPLHNARMIRGIRYLSYEISTVLLPLQSGNIEIPASLIELDQVEHTREERTFDPFGQGSIFSDFGRLQHKTLRTKAITVKVQPLPQKNRPQNFSNLVGYFIISARLSREEVEVGNTTTLTVTVSGQGNIQDLALPSPQWGDNFKVYEDQPNFRQTNEARAVSGEKVYTFALVPLKPGRLRVPSIHLDYFDPTKGDYVTIQTRTLSLSVVPGESDSKLEITGRSSAIADRTGDSLEKTGEDILPIHTLPEIFENQYFGTTAKVWFAIGLLLPAGLFLIYSRLLKHHQRLKYDIAFSRSHSAHKQAEKKLHALSPNMSSRKIARESSLIIREYLGNILNLQGTAITSTEVEEKLTKGDFSKEEIQATQELLEKREAFQYAPAEENTSEDLIQEAISLLDLLEKKP